MDWTKILVQIFEICIIPLLGALCTFLIAFIRKKSKALQEKTNNELLDRLIAQTEEIVVTCIKATNQTYVESLKDKNAFDAEAQKTAFKKTYETVLGMLSEDAKKMIADNYGDVAQYITTLIESKIKQSKK